MLIGLLHGLRSCSLCSMMDKVELRKMQRYIKDERGLLKL